MNNVTDVLKSLGSSDLQVFANSTESVTLDELVVLLQAQHATFDPITMSWGNGDEDLGQWVETTNYPNKWHWKRFTNNNIYKKGQII